MFAQGDPGASRTTSGGQFSAPTIIVYRAERANVVPAWWYEAERVATHVVDELERLVESIKARNRLSAELAYLARRARGRRRPPGRLALPEVSRHAPVVRVRRLAPRRTARRMTWRTLRRLRAP